MTLPALTLRQPVATLIALGDLRAVVRAEPPEIPAGARIALHAAQHRSTIGQVARWRLRLLGVHANALPYGAVVATAILTGWLPTDRLRPDATERALQDWRPGRFAWQLDAIHPLPAPIRATGERGLWTWTPPDALDPRALGLALGEAS